MVGQIFEKTIFNRLLNDITTYFNIYDYLKIKVKQSSDGKVNIKNVEEFMDKNELYEYFKDNLLDVMEEIIDNV